ncbi:MAG: MMPL family transporter, partial [Planctomycetota bacterium]|nr:MMPL family transporter [Planctomycetota bacterium]
SESPSTAHPAIQIRRFRLLLTYCLLCLPLIVFGARAALRVNANSRLTWVSEDFPARRDFDAFRKTFGSGDVVVMGWEGCTIDDGRLTKLTKLLRHSKTFTQRDGSACFERVISGGEAYSALIQPPVDLSEEEAARRLRGTLLGPDGNSTCLVIAFTPEALVDRARLVRLIRLAANRHCSIPANDLHLAGPVLDGLEVDRASQASLDGFAIPSAIAVLALCFVFLRDWRAALLVFGLSVFCEGATLALVHYCGDSMSALLIVLPPLIQTAAVSGGIHLVNYYFDAATDGAVGAQAASRAIRLAWLPVALSAGTTAIGLGSLMVSDLAPIRSFGAYGTVGMLLTTGLLLTVIPGVFALFPELLKRRVNLVPRAEVSWSNAGWMQLSRFLARWHGVVAFGACAAIVGLGLGAGGLNTSVRIETLFDQNSSLLKDYAWLEHKIGPLVPIEIVMRCDARCQLTQLDRLRLVDDIEREAARLTGVGGTMSAATFAPDLQPPEGVSDEAFAQIAGRSLEEGRPKLIEVNYLHESGPVQEWRITARVSALAKLDYGQFLDVVHERIQPLVADEGNEPLRGVSLRSTGIMPV